MMHKVIHRTTFTFHKESNILQGNFRINHSNSVLLNLTGVIEMSTVV